MLTLDGVSGRSGYILFQGLDISQCQIHGETVFHNETFGKMHVGLRQAGKESIGFEIPSGSKLKMENLEGEFDLSVIHIHDIMEVKAFLSKGKMSLSVEDKEIHCSGHGAKLTITPLDHSSTAVS